jgi:DnaJ-class molecular chaperone
MQTKPQDTIEDRCETCFGTGQRVEMKPPRLGQKIPAPPVCPTCEGTGLKLDAR